MSPCKCHLSSTLHWRCCRKWMYGFLRILWCRRPWILANAREFGDWLLICRQFSQMFPIFWRWVVFWQWLPACPLHWTDAPRSFFLWTYFFLSSVESRCPHFCRMQYSKLFFLTFLSSRLPFSADAALFPAQFSLSPSSSLKWETNLNIKNYLGVKIKKNWAYKK